MTRTSIDVVATTYSLLDLQAALQEYTIQFHNRTIVYGLGGRRSSNSYDIPFQALHVWDHIRMQSKCFHKPHKVLPAHTVNAMPKSDDDWQFGRFHSVLVNKGPNKIWPQLGLDGMSFNLNIKSSYIFCTLRSLCGQNLAYLQYCPSQRPIINREYGTIHLSGLCREARHCSSS